MTSTGKEWLFVIIFFAAFTAITVAEITWLSRSKNVLPKRAALFVLVPNFFVITAGLFVSFVIFVVIFAIAWDGTASKLPSPDLTIGSMIALAILIPIALMVVIRRLMFRLLKAEESTVQHSPWIYSVGSAVIFFVVVFGPPFMLFLF